MPQNNRSDGLFIAIGVAIASLLVIGILSITGAFYPAAGDRQASLEAMKRSIETQQGPAMGPALVWRRSFDEVV
jgi:hypothetical protein